MPAPGHLVTRWVAGAALAGLVLAGAVIAAPVALPGSAAAVVVPPGGGRVAAPAEVAAQNQPDHGQDDELQEGERVGHGDAKDLSGTSLLATVAAIAGASLAVVLAGLGAFRRRST